MVDADVASTPTSKQDECRPARLLLQSTPQPYSMSALIQIPAGRSIRRSDNAKWVDPQPEKGTIELSLDQGIVNFSEFE